MSSRNHRNPTVLIGIITVMLFFLAFRIKHPLIIGAAILGMLVTYANYRINYVRYKRQLAKKKRREGAIDISTDE